MLDHSNQMEDDFYNKEESSFVRNLLLSLWGNLSGSNLLFLTYMYQQLLYCFRQSGLK